MSKIKTIREWFDLLPDNGLREMALKNTSDRKLRLGTGDLATALELAFDWNKTAPDRAFWEGIHERAVNGFYEMKYGTPSATLTAVMDDLKLREMRGLGKYYTTVDRSDLTLEDWLQHAYEEVLDEAMYLKRALIKIREGK